MKKLICIGFLLLCSITLISANTRETVKLAKCVDGDTTRFYLHNQEIKVRYLAINAPEYTKEKEPYGKEASSYVCDVLTSAKKIELEYDDGSDKLDKYGRTLAWIYVDNKLLQAELLKQGLAEVDYIYGEYAHTDELKNAEKQAKANKLAMWSDENHEDSKERVLLIGSIAGVVLILLGSFVVNGKQNKKRMIQQGLRTLKKGYRYKNNK